MANYFLGDKTLSIIYKHFNVEKTDDPVFTKLFNSMSDWLIKIDNNRDCIHPYIIHSDRAQIFVVPKSDKKNFLLVWDTAFWEFYYKFLLLFFLFDSYMKDDILHCKGEEEFYQRLTVLWKNSIIDFLSKRFSNNKEAVSFFVSFKESNMLKTYVTIDTMRKIDNILTISKEFVLMHEFEHILYHISNEIYIDDTIAFDNIVKYYRDHIVDELDESITHINPNKFKKILDGILDKKDMKLYNELYGDYHAFFEILDYNMENYKNTKDIFSKRIPEYIFSIKLLKMFESCINFVTQVVMGVLSTKYQDHEIREQHIIKIANDYQRIVYSRDYLSNELFSVAMILHAQEFPINLNEFIASIDTYSFVLPYTEKMQPLLNIYTNDLVNMLMLIV